MKLRSFGCSLIHGTDLSDAYPEGRWPRSSRLTWPALVAQQLDLDYQCHAHGGSGNLSIQDRLLKVSAAWPTDIFVVNWTFIDRFDYSDHKGMHFNNGPFDWSTIKPGDIDEPSTIYYRDLHSEYRDKLTALTAIYTAISVLSARRQKFFMTYEDPLLLDQRWNAGLGIVDLQERIRPYLNDIDGQTFIEWSRSQGHAVSDSLHPLESAHAEAAEIHRPRIESILHTA